MKIQLVALSFLFTAALVFDNATAKAQTSTQSVIKAEAKTVQLKITGMTCASCNSHVATTLQALDGIVTQKVNYPGDVATVTFNPAKTSVAVIIKAIEKLGYKASTVSGKSVVKQN